MAHDYGETSRDENANRIRTIETCAICGAWRLATYAFRLDSDGRTAWGPPGVWWHSGWTVSR